MTRGSTPTQVLKAPGTKKTQPSTRSKKKKNTLKIKSENQKRKR